jgi:cytochrome c-type biogenesis protein CcmH
MAKLIMLALFCFLVNANANDAQSRARHLFEQVKCPTCQGQSVKESNAPSAEHIKAFIIQSIENGLTDEEILEELKRSFGEQIVFDPGFNDKSVILWLLPVVFASTLLFLLWKKLVIIRK